VFEEADRPAEETAKPDDAATARRAARSRLTDALRRHDPAYWERLRARFGVTAEPP
jgi:hypothetical protein